MIFEDRRDAGHRLAEALAGLRGTDAVVLGIPRGGVIVADVVASELSLPLDVVVPRKIGAPGNPELGLGAVAPGVRVLDRKMIDRLRVPEAYLDAEVAAQEREIARRLERYRAGRPGLDVSGRVAVVVDDGVATGGTAIAALRWAKAADAARVVLAVPVAPFSTIERLRGEADEVIALETPEPFYAVGEWYRRFTQTTDDEVVTALAGSGRETS